MGVFHSGAAQLGFSGTRGCWAQGRGQGWAWAAPSPPCHSASTRQRSSQNAPGQDKTEQPPVSPGRDGRGQPEGIPEEVLQLLQLPTGAEGGRAAPGRGCCSFSAARPAPSSTSFRAHLSYPFQLDGCGQTKGNPSSGAPPSSSPMEPGAQAISNGVQRSSRDPSALEQPLLP